MIEKPIPPEIVDAVFVAIGWILKWLKDNLFKTTKNEKKTRI